MNKKFLRRSFLQGFACFCLLVGTSFAQAEKSRLAPENASEAQANLRWPPERIIDKIGVTAGMAVAEIGAGRGRIVVYLADRVGPQGKVYAEDIDSDALRHLAERCLRVGFTNVEVVLGDVTDPKLPEGTLDLILIVGSYQHFSDPVALMLNARPALKENGTVAIGDRFAEKDGPNGVSEETMKRQMIDAGFVFERVDKSLEDNKLYIYLFRPRRTSSP